MKFGIVVGGAFLLVAGLLAYSMIPNFHTVPLQSAQMVVNPKPIPVSSASLSETLVASSVSTLVARDGGMNFAGLGRSLIGLLVTLYGVFAKTVIPWE